jgi:hypothetical protein
MKNDAVLELHASFSGFFTVEELYQALVTCNNDVAETAQWLIDEGEQDRSKKAIVKKKVVLLAESEVLPPNPTALLQATSSNDGLPPPSSGRKPGEMDVQCKEGSVLSPSHIVPGRWTISQVNEFGK